MGESGEAKAQLNKNCRQQSSKEEQHDPPGLGLSIGTNVALAEHSVAVRLPPGVLTSRPAALEHLLQGFRCPPSPPSASTQGSAQKQANRVTLGQISLSTFLGSQQEIPDTLLTHVTMSQPHGGGLQLTLRWPAERATGKG